MKLLIKGTMLRNILTLFGLAIAIMPGFSNAQVCGNMGYS